MRAIIIIKEKCILSSTSYTVFQSMGVRILSPITIAFFLRYSIHFVLIKILLYPCAHFIYTINEKYDRV